MSNPYVSRAKRMVKQAVMEPVRDGLVGSVYGAVARVRTRDPYVALTFDDGPDPRWTPAVLDVLAKHSALATFFLVGEAARAHPDVVARTVAAGHAIGSHTDSHPSLPSLQASEVEREIRDGHAALGEMSGPLFRPPYGLYGLKVAKAAKRLGLTTVLWNVHADDWLRQGPDELRRKLSGAVRPGAIVLLHDSLATYGATGQPDRTDVIEALDELLAANAGVYRFVTVPQLLAKGRPVKVMAEPLSAQAPPRLARTLSPA